ncbi:NAD(P)H-dependent oxidoreductase [Maritalea mobilis]|uniref:NAD(P)H-dependent oxidoreductase n=1 Tax=Maritalea mobilis TaxID=483324 RepID=UPI001C944C6D|nr:NAD(P)H-dependent oxidoreductase [Maritalea mobilis]MBY6202694.1 NAD(P)H-dependent oxidoreductase [Maritalea mobilis]
MRALVVYCHPRAESFTAAIRDLVLEKLRKAGAEIRLRDLYAEGFAPALTATELELYEDESRNKAAVARDVDDLMWCDTLIFVYPTWWYGLPAMLKGWLDRTMVPGVAFLMPDDENQNIRPGLRHITRLGVFTTCGASWALTRYVGAPGRRTLLRGVGHLCARHRKVAFAAHYLMDRSTAATRDKHLKRVAAKMDRLLSGGRAQKNEASDTEATA